jgi:hypothetical protein
MAKAKSSIKKARGTTIVTPVGKALFVSAPRASQFDDNKQEATIVLSADAKAEVEAILKAFIKENAAEIGKKPADITIPFKEDTDSDGDFTGNYRLKAKTGMKYPAQFVGSDNSKFSPDMDYQLPNGADIRLSITPELLATSMFQGLTLRLNGIKVLGVKQYDLGFSDDDEGDYVYGDDTASEGTDTPQTSDDDWA